MSFQQIKGQQRPIQILKNALSINRIPFAYLFVGPEGVGKRLVAKIFSQALNCLNKEDDACDKCISCLKIDSGQHPDVHFISPIESDEIKIEQIRELKKEINLKPHSAKKKVFIIDDAHNLNSESANAILKILEEPPEDSLIILITHKPKLMFKTIISRCRILKFYPLKRSELENILKNDYGLEKNLSHFLAYFSEGRLGYALSLKDKDILEQRNNIVNVFTFKQNAYFLNNFSLKNREELKHYLNLLASWFRDICFLKIGIAYNELINLDRKNDLLKLMNRYNFVGLDLILNTISDSIFFLENKINPKLIISHLRMTLWKGLS